MSSHHLFEGGLYDSHHQALQTDDLLHVKAHRRVADGVGVLPFLRGPLLSVCLEGAAVLGQANGRVAVGIFQEVADLPKTVSDEAVKELGGHDGGARTRVSIIHPPEVEGDSCAVLKWWHEIFLIVFFLNNTITIL